jgi:hypothetical protein
LVEVEGSWEEMAEEGLWWEEVVKEVMGHWYRDHFGSILHSSQDRFHNNPIESSTFQGIQHQHM